MNLLRSSQMNGNCRRNCSVIFPAVCLRMKGHQEQSYLGSVWSPCFGSREYLKRIAVFAGFSSFIWHLGAQVIAISSCLTAPDRMIVSKHLHKSARRHHEMKEAVEA